MNKQEGEVELLKTALCSELWAYESLNRMGSWIDSFEIKDQAEDEFRHANMLEALILLSGKPSDKKSSTDGMQTVLYQNVCGISLPKSDKREDIQFFFAFHEIMERRAIWIYKTLIRSTNNKIIKEILQQILKDEAGHIHKIPVSDNIKINNLIAADKWLFKYHLPRHYNNMKLTECPKFWEDYWNHNIIQADGKQYNTRSRNRS